MRQSALRAELVELLARGLPRPGGRLAVEYAGEVADELLVEVERYGRSDALQTAARAALERSRRGRPLDWAERDFETRVLGVLAAHIKIRDTAGSVAVEVLARLSASSRSDHRNALRRAKRRARAIAALQEYLDRGGEFLP